MRFDLTTLNLVLATADTRSITRGAGREHLALAAASKRVSGLRARFGVPLFERRARGVEPTEAGRALVRLIRSLQTSLHALEGEVVEFSRAIEGHLRIVANAIAQLVEAGLGVAVMPAAVVKRFVDALGPAPHPPDPGQSPPGGAPP